MAGLIASAGSGATEFLGEEAGVSPVTASGQSTVSLSFNESYDEVIFLIDSRESTGFNQLRFNNVSSAEYRYTSEDGTETAGATEWSIPSVSNIAFLRLKQIDFGGDTVGFTAGNMGGGSGAVSGVYAAGFGTPQDSLDSVQFLNGSSDDLRARVIGRQYNL